MTRLSIVLASALALTFGGQNAMAKDRSLAADVEAAFGQTASGAGPISLIGTISRSMSGLAEDLCPVTMIDTISRYRICSVVPSEIAVGTLIAERSELVEQASTLSSEETKWPPNPFDAQARAIEDSFEPRWYRERSP